MATVQTLLHFLISLPLVGRVFELARMIYDREVGWQTVVRKVYRIHKSKLTWNNRLGSLNANNSRFWRSYSFSSSLIPSQNGSIEPRCFGYIYIPKLWSHKVKRKVPSQKPRSKSSWTFTVSTWTTLNPRTLMTILHFRTSSHGSIIPRPDRLPKEIIRYIRQCRQLIYLGYRRLSVRLSYNSVRIRRSLQTALDKRPRIHHKQPATGQRESTHSLWQS